MGWPRCLRLFLHVPGASTHLSARAPLIPNQVALSTGAAVGGGGNAPTIAPTGAPTLAPGDLHASCGYWAGNGECTKNPGYMNVNCIASCAAITGGGTPTNAPTNAPTPAVTVAPTPTPTTTVTTSGGTAAVTFNFADSSTDGWAQSTGSELAFTRTTAGTPSGSTGPPSNTNFY